MGPDSHLPENPHIGLADRPSSELARLWQSGNEEAAAILVDRYAMRMLALAASRMGRQLRDAIDPEDVAQSALGSFFTAIKGEKVLVSESASLWGLLATFTRRKLARHIEKQSAEKRGGDRKRVTLDEIGSLPKTRLQTEDHSISDLITDHAQQLPTDLQDVLDLIRLGETQRDISRALKIDERTVRRRLDRIRKTLRRSTRLPTSTGEFSTGSLPQVGYNEFVLGKLIGVGGFGKVYRASWQATGQVIAVKFLRKAFWQHESARQAFLREIDLASQVDHPRVNRYLGWGMSPHGGPYVLSEWIDGKTLDHFQNVAPDRFVHFLQQLCETLGVVHRAGIVHGDISPKNVMVDADDHVFITDFGFSKRLGVQSGGRRSSEVNEPLGGTIGFAAPEQVSSAFGDIGPKTDLYAVGGLAYWHLTGKPPHFADQRERGFSDTLAPSNVELTKPDNGSPDLKKIRYCAAKALRKPITHRPTLHQLTRSLRR